MDKSSIVYIRLSSFCVFNNTSNAQTHYLYEKLAIEVEKLSTEY